jgi:LPS export ABC transporter protein LptC
MSFLLLQKPYNVEVNTKSKKEANIEMLEAKNYSISKDGIALVATATRVLRFNTHDEFYDIDVLRKLKDNAIDNLKADRGTLVKSDLELMGKVRYKNSEGVTFSSQEALYNLDSKIFKTDVDFILEDNRSVTYGSSLKYETNDGKIYASKIRSIARIDEK